jgi:hypothetical protein
MELDRNLLKLLARLMASQGALFSTPVDGDINFHLWQQPSR